MSSEAHGFEIGITRGEDGVYIHFEDPVSGFEQYLTDVEARELMRLLDKYVENDH